MTSNNDTLLIQKSKQGDVHSFELLISKYQVYAYNIAWRMLGNEEDAKDATQETLIKVFKGLDKFKENSEFSTWLYTITVNTCRDLLRKRKKSMAISVDDTEDKIPIQLVADDAAGPEAQLEQKEVAGQLLTALGKIPEFQKTAVLLRDVYGFSYEEIGAIENCSVGTVKSRISRGRHGLRTLILNERSKNLQEGGTI
ncbi:RNA polymerase sigma factor [Acidaminobacter hydrogenoformans]|uniref:RNA polymerase, sigma-24 subunit, RpoE n=1 Tax=Acidaminobacter hydrogenoformans DSM 2784 TaxID=1120920 RepID=A0A1G5RTA8_9FIRM|nr:sigma-70 family RNA polymerase sigma factor [Acidaminobacter hydrogenoformans]SCZ77226.1 RNA polymerase, sigma-24 subunit, RpoE [Acidaminobacter hydrogenoformans DSM 2784]